MRLALALFIAAMAAACQVAPDASTHSSTDPEKCATCHMDAFRSASAPVHVGTRPDTCAVCHSQDAWSPKISNHPWPLTGAHQKASCFSCHKGEVAQYHATPKDCFSCHKKEYDKAPNHVAKKFSTKCEGCHQTDEWSDRLGAPARP